MDWTQILADKAKYPDDAKININGVEVTLGAVRAQNTASQGDLEKKLNTRQQELDQVARQQTAATDNLAKIVDNVQRVTGLSVEDIVAGRIPANLKETVAAATRSTVTAAGVTLAEDPLYAPVMKELEPIRASVHTTRQALLQSLEVYKSDRARLDHLDWLAANKPPAEFKVTRQDAINLAVNKGYKNAEGWPDVTRALDELAAPLAAKATETELAAKYREEGRREARAELAASMGQPTMGMSGEPTAGGVEFSGTPEPAGHRVASIREQLSKAFADPKMLATATIQ
jgi:hypothetical protein